MRMRNKLGIAVAALAPLVLAVVAEWDSKSHYTAVYIGVPYTERALMVEFLPEALSFEAVSHFKTKGIFFNRFPVSSSLVPVVRKSFNPFSNAAREWDWVYVKATIAIVSLIMLVALIVITKELRSGEGTY